jgi:hypothetical protein
MRGSQTLPGDPLPGVMPADSPYRAAQNAAADRVAALATLARITGA